MNNKIKRISSLLESLSKGYCINTPDIAKLYGVSNKIIQTDFKDYILPLFNDKTIYYDYAEKCYKATNNFLSKTLFCAEELAIISILKNKSKDKYSDSDLAQKVDVLFSKFEDELTNAFYQKSSIEKIDTFKQEIIQIKNAIETKHIINCSYNDKLRVVFPLKILNLEGFWYLIIFDTNDTKLKTFHLNSIKDIRLSADTYLYDDKLVEKFNNAITAYYKPHNEEITVQLFIDKAVAKYFIRKPISPTQRILNTYANGDIEIEIIITDIMEIIPTIQRYIPFVYVIEPQSIKNEIIKNITNYIKNNY